MYYIQKKHGYNRIILENIYLKILQACNMATCMKHPSLALNTKLAMHAEEEIAVQKWSCRLEPYTLPACLGFTHG
jgi:hypothetical protein